MDQEAINALRQETVQPPKMILGGRAVSARSGKSIDVVSPIDGATIAQLPDANEEDVQEAVAEAAANRKESDKLEAEAAKGAKGGGVSGAGGGSGVVTTDDSLEVVSNSEIADPPGT